MKAADSWLSIASYTWKGTILVLTTTSALFGAGDVATYRSPFLELALSRTEPAITALSVDSLGGAAFAANALREVPSGSRTYLVREVTHEGLVMEYRAPDLGETTEPVWRLSAEPSAIRLASNWSVGSPVTPLTLQWDPHRCHATLLGHCREDGAIQLPAILHLPGSGSLRIRTADGVPAALTYDARRAEEGYIRVTFPAANDVQPKVEYVCEVVTIHPSLGPLETDPRFAAVRRDWLSIFQWNPRLRVLANHAASDTCAFCLYEYADIALHTPPLADQLSALDLIRASLDRYLDGMPGYGLPGYSSFDIPSPPSEDPPFLDSYPSLLIAAFNYVAGTDDQVWLAKRYAGVRGWAEALLAMDRDGDGLVEYAYSGNSGSWSGKADKRPANWWDCIGFGHQDAYANALAYRALCGMRKLADARGESEDARRYAEAADRLRSVYYDTFYNPATGVLAGWRSADGQLHDYYFLYVNCIAICYDLLSRQQADAIMDRLWDKMRAVGYDRFDLGLPGNLIAVPRKDYVHLDRRWGGGVNEDNSDGFQIYENGGATACFAYFTVAALYKLDRRREADSILLPILQSVQERRFQGRAENGMTYDWKAWDGSPWGYEGFLVDNYYVLLAVLARQGSDRTCDAWDRP